jgi:tetratricopeptide (TPR) repeat protein
MKLELHIRIPFIAFLLFGVAISATAQKKPVKKKKKSIENLQTAFDYFNKGSELANAGKCAEAIRYFDKSISMDKRNYEPYFNRGVCKYNLHDYESAIPDLTQSMKLHPKIYHDALYYRGRCYTMTGRYDLAVSDFNKALAIASNADLWSARGFAYLHLLRYEDALSDFTYAIALNSNVIENYASRAVCNYNLHHLDDAISDAEKYLQKFPRSADILEIEMRARYEKGDYEGAYSLAQRLVEISKTGLTYYFKGMIEYNLKKYTEGIEDFTSSIQADSTFRDAWYARALSYLAINDDAHACPDLKKARKMGFPGLDKSIDGYCKDIKE